MSKALILLIVLVLALAVTGCKTSSGSREYIPGKGWVPND
jgi:predicted small secreted protein